MALDTDGVGGPDGRELEPNCSVDAPNRWSQAGLITPIWRPVRRTAQGSSASLYWIRLSLPWKMPSTSTSSDLHTSPSWRDTWLDWSWIFASMPTIFAGILLTHAVHLRL